jgi:hypothetical protein
MCGHLLSHVVCAGRWDLSGAGAEAREMMEGEMVEVGELEER